jgi:hypothetical protein
MWLTFTMNEANAFVISSIKQLLNLIIGEWLVIAVRVERVHKLYFVVLAVSARVQWQQLEAFST